LQPLVFNLRERDKEGRRKRSTLKSINLRLVQIYSLNNNVLLFVIVNTTWTKEGAKLSMFGVQKKYKSSAR